ncbi:MAG: GDYXXLXY domain-containing protein [Marinilabiliaceae bacterium]|nr:GDYXXLXY domain-containing protein [Marinilabiliaceae bacterium]
MDKKYILPFLFLVVALVQLWVPASMIWKSESVLNDGKVFRFKTAPIDPVDPFRGKYVTLAFDVDEQISTADVVWYKDEYVYVKVLADSEGFAEIESISKKQPDDSSDYFKTTVRYAGKDENGANVRLHFPFDKYYMEESKAFEAEVAVRELAQDRSQVAYAIVSIQDGEARLKEVMVNEVPLKDWVEQMMEERE